MKVVGIIQARMGSSRLPGKVLRPLCGEPMLARILERLGRCRRIDELVIATSTDPRDGAIVDFAKSRGFRWGTGPEDDVLGRYHKVAVESKADVVIRLTGDCPLIEPSVTDEVIRRHLASGGNDMTSNVLVRTYPRGLDSEALSFACLDRVHREAADAIYREHVTNYIHDFQDRFRLENVSNPVDRSELRWCVDTPDDYELLTRIYDELYPANPSFGWTDVLRLVESRPELKTLNAHVPQAKIFRNKLIP